MDFDSIYEQLGQLQLLSFYGWWEFGVCLFGSIALLSIWYHIGRKQKDFGQVWLAISVLCWSVSGLFDVYFSYVQSVDWQSFLGQAQNDPSSSATLSSLKQELTQRQSEQAVVWTGWRSIFSLFNSFFILLALPWFRYIPQKVGALVTSKYWRILVGLPFVFCLLPTVRKIFAGADSSLVSELDVYYSVLTLIFLGIVMWSSFAKRRLPLLAWLSLLCILITFIAQVYKMLDAEINVILFSAIFKTSLIMIFFALALSWVKELSENTISASGIMGLKLSSKSNQSQRITREVTIEFANKSFDLTLSETHYKLLHAFATKRMKHASTEQDWLEIKPKTSDRNGRIYEIQDYNQIKRLLHALLDGMYGKSNWNQEIHGSSLKEALFEKSEKFPRLVRLRLDSDRIEIN